MNELVGNAMGGFSPKSSDEIRRTIDEVKKIILDYYSNLYSFYGNDIDTKLRELSSKNLLEPPGYRNPNFIGKPNNYDDSDKTVEDKNADVNRLNNISFNKDPYLTPSSQYKAKSKGQFDTYNSNDLYRKFNQQSNRLSNDTHQHESYRPDFNEINRSSNYLSRHNEVNEEVLDMLNNMKKKCLLSSSRISNLEDYFSKTCDDPNSSEFSLYHLHKDRVKPTFFGDRKELKNYLITIYADLKSQFEVNKKKIASLQTKMKLLNIHCNNTIFNGQVDPRSAL